MIRRLLVALALLLATTGYAAAGPIIGAIGALAGGISIGAVLVQTAIGLAISFGASLLQRALAPKQPGQRDPGIQFEVEVGDANPIGFVVGRGATAGTRKYIGAWGKSGKTPNAYLTDVIQIGDLPAPGRPGLWVNGKKCTILWDDTPVDQGYPVEEFRVEGIDYLWVRYRDGSETVADTFLLAKFGADPDRNWQSDMIGRGCPHLIITALFNRDLFPGQMQWLAEPPAVAFYDPRLDDTLGGSGDHRWDDQSTWEPTDNPAVVIYNLARGVYYDDGDGYREWVYGGQNLAAIRLPAAAWMAAANACDELIDLEDGGSEKQYRCGMEIRGDMEPLSAIEELLKACSGRMPEVGGAFKMVAGAPGSAVYSFSDNDILITEGQSLEPFPGLDETHNGIEATYPEPTEMWSSKDAPALYWGDLEEADGNRRLTVGVSYPAVPFGVQVQRLNKAMLVEERKFLTHSFHLPPEAWRLEPGVDVLSFSSARNGYADKKFLLVSIRGARTINQLVVLKEIDPAEGYDWDPDTDEQPSSIGFLGPIRPPPQPMSGWQASGATMADAGGNPRRPTIKVEFAGGQEDVRAVRVQVRLTATGAIIFDGEIPYDVAVASPSVILNGTFLPATEYEARGRFVPYSGRLTEWSAWLAVTTPDTRISQAELDASLDALIRQVRDQIPADLLVARQMVDDLSASLASQVATILERLGRLNIAVGARYGENKASAELALTATADLQSAFAALLVNVVAETDAGVAESLLQIIASSSSEAGVLALISMAVRAGHGGAIAEAALELAAVETEELGLHSRVRVKADQFDGIDGDGNVFPFFSALISEAFPTPVNLGNVEVDLGKHRLIYKTNLNSDATVVFPLNPYEGASWKLLVRQTGSFLLNFDLGTYLFSDLPPTMPPGADVYALFEGTVISIQPPVAEMHLISYGSLSLGSNRRFSIFPAISGRSVWDLDQNGPCTIPPGTYTITPLIASLICQGEFQGPGGNSAGYRSSPGGDSSWPQKADDLTFDYTGGTLVAGGAYPGTSNHTSTDRNGGSASGGNVSNTVGNTGGASVFESFNAHAQGGQGAASPSGAAAVNGTTINFSTSTANGKPGNSPGGGAAGGLWTHYNGGGANYDQGTAYNGAGSGGRVVHNFTDGMLVGGTIYTLVVPDSNEGVGVSTGKFVGARGGGGRVVLT